SSPTACPPSAPPTRSSWSTAGASSSAAPTTSSWPPPASTPSCTRRSIEAAIPEAWPRRCRRIRRRAERRASLAGETQHEFANGPLEPRRATFGEGGRALAEVGLGDHPLHLRYRGRDSGVEVAVEIGVQLALHDPQSSWRGLT